MDRRDFLKAVIAASAVAFVAPAAVAAHAGARFDVGTRYTPFDPAEKLNARGLRPVPDRFKERDDL